MRHFIINGIDSKVQSLATRLFDEDDNHLGNYRLGSIAVCLMQSLSFWILLLYVVAVSYYLVTTNPTIGGRSAPLFLVVLIAALAANGVVIETCVLYVWWVIMITNSIGRHILMLLERLKQRARIVLIRSTGIVRNFSGKLLR